jgi:hypothetical protein
MQLPWATDMHAAPASTAAGEATPECKVHDQRGLCEPIAGAGGRAHRLWDCPPPSMATSQAAARSAEAPLPAILLVLRWLQLRQMQRRISRDGDIVVAAMVSIVGSTLIFQGWRLDPLLLLSQVRSLPCHLQLPALRCGACPLTPAAAACNPQLLHRCCWQQAAASGVGQQLDTSVAPCKHTPVSSLLEEQ